MPPLEIGHVLKRVIDHLPGQKFVPGAHLEVDVGNRRFVKHEAHDASAVKPEAVQVLICRVHPGGLQRVFKKRGCNAAPVLAVVCIDEKVPSHVNVREYLKLPGRYAHGTALLHAVAHARCAPQQYGKSLFVHCAASSQKPRPAPAKAGRGWAWRAFSRVAFTPCAARRR